MGATTLSNRAWLVVASIAGIGAITCLHPHIQYASSPFNEWLYLVSLPLAAAAVCFWVYSLLLPNRARGGWPAGFLALAWLFAIANVVSPRMDRAPNAEAPAMPEHSASPSQERAAAPSEIEEVLKNAPPHDPNAKPASEIDEVLKTAPAYRPAG